MVWGVVIFFECHKNKYIYFLHRKTQYGNVKIEKADQLFKSIDFGVARLLFCCCLLVAFHYCNERTKAKLHGERMSVR